jgi:hypothetical protein
VSQRHLNEQTRRAFSALTRPPRPQLSERIRDSVWGRPAPAAKPVRLPALPVPPAAIVGLVVLVALIALAVLEWPAVARAGGGVSSGVASLLKPYRPAAAPTSAASPTALPTPTPSPSASATPSPTPTPEPTATPVPTPAPPTPIPATLPGFSCGPQSGGGGQSTMSTARVGAQTGYDRFVVQFNGPVPQFDVTLQDPTAFGAMGLEGSAGYRVVLHNATGAGTYSGFNDTRPAYPVIREVKLLSDSQGVVEFDIGVARAGCFHAWALTGPSRLVVDIAGP